MSALQMIPDILVNHENSSRLRLGPSAAAAGDRGGLLALSSEVFEDAAVRGGPAETDLVAGVDIPFEAPLLQLRHFAAHFDKMSLGQIARLRAGTSVIPGQARQLPDLRVGKPEIATAPNEGQTLDERPVVHAMTAGEGVPRKATWASATTLRPDVNLMSFI
ncbi:hypothetical protein MESS2_1600002 [Mesorhizobium metallidurans STM 2683]|uniref:Uncharacterized protein n=1 Tax=Mesorhizobium metallidurans STM 2683 TaxID=1297569 RepID=M5EN47_9HYPH|nr:hypothetical protein MESS2_1600002 [Mesorhizobium metallidurans STM 2683]